MSWISKALRSKDAAHVKYLTWLTLINIMVDASWIAEDDLIKEESATHDEIWYTLNNAGIRICKKRNCG